MLVYKHTVPNGKVYIGIAKDGFRRWNNGQGYKDNTEFYNDICHYGWKSLKTVILQEGLTEKEALAFEKNCIIAYDSENQEKGYNRTDYKQSLLKLEEKVIDKHKQAKKKILSSNMQEMDNEQLKRSFHRLIKKYSDYKGMLLDNQSAKEKLVSFENEVKTLESNDEFYMKKVLNTSNESLIVLAEKHYNRMILKIHENGFWGLSLYSYIETCDNNIIIYINKELAKKVLDKKDELYKYIEEGTINLKKQIKIYRNKIIKVLTEMRIRRKGF